MRDPYLRRPVWLTADQRHRLRDGALSAMRHDDADIDLCQSLLLELLDATHRETTTTRLVHTMIAGLQMPEDTVPVFLCEAEISQVITYGELDVALRRVLDPVRKGRGSRG